MKHSSSTRAIGLFLAYTGAGFLPANAQTSSGDSAAGSTARIEEIVVTATRREQSLQDVPVAVTALSGDFLDSAGVVAVEALAAVTPSVTFTQSSNDLNNSVNIRGIGTSVFSQGVEPSVSVVVDDVILARQGMSFQDLADIERIEVLRGPQSTLFGKNASAGVISVTTANPTYELETKFDATIAEGDEYIARGTVSGPLAAGVSGRLTAYYNDRRGHIENQGDGRDLNGYENWGLRGKLLLEPSSELGITLIADFRQTEQECCIYTVRDTSGAIDAAADGRLDALLDPVVAGEENAQSKVNAPVFNDSDQWGASAKIEYDFGENLSFTSITAVRGWDFENNLDVDNLDLEEPQLGFITFDLNSGNTDLTQYSQEFRLTGGTPSGRLDYVLGAYAFFLDLDRDFRRRFEILVPVGGGATARINQSGQFNSAVETTNLALFGSGNFRLTDRTTAFGGLRVIWEELDYELFRDPANVLVAGDRPFGGNPGTFAAVDDKTDDTAVTGEIGLSHDFSDDVTVYAKYARGYKGQAVDVGFGAPADFEPIDAETSDAFELGLKSVLAGGNLLLNVAIFHTEYDDFQEQATILLEDAEILNAEVRLTNVGTVSTSGVEIEAIATPTDTLTLQGGVSYTDASIEDFDNAGCYFGQTAAQGCLPVTLSDGGTPGDPSDDVVTELQDLSGGDLPNAPEWRFTASVRQDIRLAATFDAFVQATGRWQSDVSFSLNGDPRAEQDSFGILNLTVGIVDDQDRYSASLFVNNVLDEFYATNVFGDPLYGGVVSHYVPRDFERYFGARFAVNL